MSSAKRRLWTLFSCSIHTVAILISAFIVFIVAQPAIGAELSFNDASWKFYDNDSYVSTTHTINSASSMNIYAAGGDVWTGYDEYGTYYLDDIDGDFIVTVKVTSQSDTNAWAKAGFMVKNNITDAAHSTGYCIMAITRSNGKTFQWDNNNNGMLDKDTTGGTSTRPVWLRMEKSGTTFTGSFSYDYDPATLAGTWTVLESRTISSANQIQDVGLFVTSHSPGNPCNVRFENFDTNTLPGITTYTISASAGVNGAITPAGNTVVTAHAAQTFTVTPNAHYQVNTVTADGSSVALTDNQYTFSNVTANHTIAATFTPITHTITATAGVNGSISPLGTVTVNDGANQIFSVTPNAGYEIENVLVDGVAATLTNDQYTFSNVTATHTIQLTFEPTPADPSAGGIPGCAASESADYSAGFNLANFDYTNIGVGANNHLVLQTGNQAINPERIVVPFTQDVSVTFLYEGAGYVSDFGWMLYDDAVNADGSFKGWVNIPQNKKHPLFTRILDDNEQGQCCGGGNGILDTDYAGGGFPIANEAALAAYNDGTGYPFIVDGDGVVTPKDMKKNLGTIQGGTEIVFFLTADKRWNTGDTNGVFFTKKTWNPDTYGACGTGTFNKLYRLGVARGEGGCVTDAGWLPQIAIDRLGSIFGVYLSGTYSLPITWGQKYSHNIVGAPPDDPNQWILGWEDLMGGGDSDHNDMVFKIDRKTGGIAELKSSQAIVPDDDNAYFTAVTFEVYDNMPCNGQTSITYSLSIDNGDTWVELTDWDVIKTYTPGAGGAHDLDPEPNDVINWSPGFPQYVYRSRRVDFAGLGQSGRALIWKAEFASENEDCAPEIVDVDLNADVATHGDVSRSTPIVQTNLFYSGYYETPALSWIEKQPRGHLLATQIYDPVDPNTTDNAEIWDAGQALTDMNPTARHIYFPDIAVTRSNPAVVGGTVSLTKGDGCMASCTTTTGDGVTKTFSGTLNHPVVATSVTITDTHEVFHDTHIDDLVGSYGGTGTINRYSGAFQVVFKVPPANGVPIRFTYSYYSTTPALLEFNTANVTNALLELDNTFIIPQGYIYDLNGDGSFSEADGDWLVNWVRGYRDGVSTKKEWLLGPVDHSVPAVATPPGKPFWYFGTAITADEKGSFDAFIDANENRRSVIYVGARDGMLHAFDAGNLQWGDNTETNVEEYRGYFKWGETAPAKPLYDSSLKQLWDVILARYPSSPPDFHWRTTGTLTKAPDYGTGKELWAFIPSNLLARLKNNLLKAEDQSYVDASPALSDVYINGTWRTVLLAAEGNGGDTVFCLDVTNPSVPLFLWEFADPELFRSRSSPSVGKIGRILVNGTTRWVAFFVSGKTYDQSLDPSIYLINIADGTVVDRIYLHAGVDSNGDGIDDGQGGVPSGQPAIIDSDANGYIDRMYIGTDKGFMFKVNLPDDPDVPRYPISQCVINMDFDYVDSSEVEHSIDTAQQRHPIYASPAVVVNNHYDEEGELSYDIRILYGTGDSPYFDEDINTGNTRYYFFCYSDTDKKGECMAYDAEQGEYSVALKWFKELDQGHRVFASAFAAAGTIYFGTSTSETEDPCAETNEGKIYAIDLETGEEIYSEVVGNITTTPMVEDEHLYFKTATGGGKIPQVRGQGGYNNVPVMVGEGQTRIRSWLELN